MTDVKTQKRNPARRRRRRTATIPRQPRIAETIIPVGWTNSSISTGTSGAISTTFGLSCQEATEYTSLANLFQEVKLVSASWTFISGRPTDTVTASLQVFMAFDVRYNSNTATAPASRDAVLHNNTWKVWNPIGAVKTFTYVAPSKQLRDLDFTKIDADAPTLPTPFAGSPGVLMLYADSGAVSTGYATLLTQASYWVRGRH